MCAVHIPQNFYRQTITRAVTLTTGVNIYVSAHPTPAEGYIAISPASTNLREIVYYTAKGTDGNGTYITVTTANRGLGGTTAQTHAIGEPVRMNVSAETIQEISDALDQIVAAGAQDATVSIKGISKGASETELGIVEEATDAEVTAGTATGATGAKLFVTPAKLKSSGILKFGGTGADGALSITSGATNIDLANAAVVTKNYTSISITGTGSLTFTNPNNNGTVVILKSQGNVTLTSSTAPMIDLKLIGAAAKVLGKASYFTTGLGGDGAENSGTTTGGYAMTATYSQISNTYIPYNIPICVGGGSGEGEETGVSTTGGVGTRGGGSLIVECGGNFNFTTTGGISVAGSNGTNASGSGAGTAGGGGGSGAGCCVILYNALTSNTGTIITTGGTGGTAYNNSSTITADGGGGGGSVTAGGGATVGTNAGGRPGYSGGDGFALVIPYQELL